MKVSDAKVLVRVKEGHPQLFAEALHAADDTLSTYKITDIDIRTGLEEHFIAACFICAVEFPDYLSSVMLVCDLVSGGVVVAPPEAAAATQTHNADDPPAK